MANSRNNIADARLTPYIVPDFITSYTRNDLAQTRPRSAPQMLAPTTATLRTLSKRPRARGSAPSITITRLLDDDKKTQGCESIWRLDVDEVRNFFTGSNRPVYMFENKLKIKWQTANTIAYDSKIFWEAQKGMSDTRTIQQQLGDVSTEFFLSKFNDKTYSQFFKMFYDNIQTKLDVYIRDKGFNRPGRPTDIRLFYKGGNLFRIILKEFVQIINIPKYNALIEKRSDADFQIFVRTDVDQYSQVLDDISKIVIVSLYEFKVTLTRSGLINVPDFEQILPLYKTLLISVMPQNNKLFELAAENPVRFSRGNMSPFRRDFLMNIIKAPQASFLGYTDVDCLLEGYSPERLTGNPLYISRNITSDFQTFSGNRYIFELIRMKRNIAIDISITGSKPVSLKVASEMIDVSIPRQNDDGSIDHSVAHMMAHGVDEYTQLYTFGEADSTIQFYGVNLKYLIYDLKDILFYKFEWPWADPKYEKRILRYF